MITGIDGLLQPSLRETAEPWQALDEFCRYRVAGHCDRDAAKANARHTENYGRQDGRNYDDDNPHGQWLSNVGTAWSN
jgi:hypothetical protein